MYLEKVERIIIDNAAHLGMTLAVQDLAILLRDKFGHVITISEESPKENDIWVGTTSSQYAEKYKKEIIGEESYTISINSNQNCLDIVGNDIRGAIFGAYWFIDRVKAGYDLTSCLGFRKPQFPLRISWAGAPMYSHTKAPEHWSHTVWLEKMDQSWHFGAPLDRRSGYTPSLVVDVDELEDAVKRFKKFCKILISLGINSITLGETTHLVSLEKLSIYKPGSSFLLRHKIYREKFHEMINYAKSLELDFYIFNDEFGFTEPMMDYIGDLCPENPKLWTIMEEKYRELFAEFPSMKGVYLRTGDLMQKSLGNIHGYYWHELLRYHNCEKCKNVSYIDRTKKLLFHLNKVVVGEFNKEVIYRTWSWGMPKDAESFATIDAMDTDLTDRREDARSNEAEYSKLFGDVPNEKIYISAKYTYGDWFCHQPINPTLGVGDHKQVAEFQTSLEFQAQGLFPCLMADEHEKVLDYCNKKNVYGIALMPQEGAVVLGMGGPNIITYFKGFSKYLESNTYACARMLWEDHAGVYDIAKDWATIEYGKEGASSIAQILVDSYEVIKIGLYVSEYAKKEFTHPNPLVRWMVIFDGLEMLKAIYEHCKEKLEETIDEGYEAVRICQKMINTLEGAKENLRPMDYSEIMTTLVHEKSLMELLSVYRETFLRYFDKQEKGDSTKESINEFTKLVNQLSSCTELYIRTYHIFKPEGIPNFLEVVSKSNLYKKELSD